MKTTFVEQTRGAFANALSAAEPGEQLVYNVGNICEGPHTQAATWTSRLLGSRKF